MVRFSATAIGLIALGLATAGCGGSDQAATAETNSAGGVEEMGPMGGGTGDAAGAAGAETAPVGEVDNGNVAPGNIDPNKPREGTDAGGNAH